MTDVATRPDAELQHYGVKGMKWGVQKAKEYSVRRNAPDASGLTRKAAKAEIKKTRRQTRDDLEDFEDLPGRDRDKQIYAARAGLKKANREYRDQKSDIKARREEMGKNAAKVALAQARHENYRINARADRNTRAEDAIEIGVAIMREMTRPRPQAPPPPPRTTTTATQAGPARPNS